MNRQEKAEQVEDIRGLLDGAQLVVLTHYSGLGVDAMMTLRRQLRGAQAGYRVMKNTLAKIATGDSELQGLAPHFKGPVGVAFTKVDPAAAAKVLADFVRDNPKLQIRAGILPGGKVLDAAGIDALSRLPSRDQLRAQLLATLNGVGTKFVRVLAAVPGGMVNVLEARRRQLAGE